MFNNINFILNLSHNFNKNKWHSQSNKKKILIITCITEVLLENLSFVPSLFAEENNKISQLL